MSHAVNPERSILTPSPDGFSFFGFDGLKPSLERLLRYAEIRFGEPGVTIVE